MKRREFLKKGMLVTSALLFRPECLWGIRIDGVKSENIFIEDAILKDDHFIIQNELSPSFYRSPLFVFSTGESLLIIPKDKVKLLREKSNIPLKFLDIIRVSSKDREITFKKRWLEGIKKEKKDNTQKLFILGCSDFLEICS